MNPLRRTERTGGAVAGRRLIAAAALVLAVGSPVDHGSGSVHAAPAPATPAPAAGAATSFAAPRQATPATIVVELCASDGQITLADGTPVDVWGFVETSTCDAGLVDDANFPGPTVRATAHDTVVFELTNALPPQASTSRPTSMLVPGQELTTDGGTAGDFAVEAGTGETVTYTIADAAAGTYLYESGTNAGIQIPMGLYGALVVDDGPGQAYGSSTAYDTDAVLLLSEIDPELNADPDGFDPLTYHPTYWLINGTSYPDTSVIPANAGDRVLLRYLNAGFDNPSMELLGAYQEVVGKQAYELTNPFSVVTEVIPAGSTADLLVDTAGLEGSFPLYNRNGYVTNADVSPGGMMTFLEVQAPIGSVPSVTIASPTQASTVFGDAVAVQIDATDTEDAAGTLTAEWRLDGGPWQTASWAGAYYESTWDTTTAGDGTHVLDARVADSDGNTTTKSQTAIVSNEPTITLVTPSMGGTIAGDGVLVQIDAEDAEDADGTLTVAFDVDGGGSQTAAWDGSVYAATLDTLGFTDGAHTINATATDSRMNEASTSADVTVSNAPTVAIVSPAAGSTVSGEVTIQIDASDVEDADGTLAVTWDASDGSGGTAPWNASNGFYEASWQTPSPPATITLGAHALDSRGFSADDSHDVIVGANSVHVGDLDGSSSPAGGPNWNAGVTATVHDVAEQPVTGATVTIVATRTRKSNGTSAQSTLTCVTDAGGQCGVTQSVNSNNFEDRVSFEVTGINSSAPYDVGLNHDPDADSDGTTILVLR